MSKQSSARARPFLTWLGRKSRLVDRIEAALPPSKRLVEPFVGSGAVFLSVQRDSYLLADTNADIIALYKLLASDPGAVIDATQALFTPENNCGDKYYSLRDRLNEIPAGSVERASIFVYLNRHGFNGLCRYTRRAGRYNVQFGNRKSIRFPGPEMAAFAERARRAEFLHVDFRTTMAMAKPGDAIYCDPPYVHVAAARGYHVFGGGFRWAEHAALASAARECSTRGIPVLISNHDTEDVRTLYSGARINEVSTPRLVSCKPGTRHGKQAEILALFDADQTDQGFMARAA